MSNLLKTDAVESAIIQGDLSKLTSDQKLSYYHKVCSSVGLNPLTKPFEYMRLNGKEVLYANKGCAEQLRSIHGISIKVTKVEKIDDIFVVIVEATNKDGRTDSATGAVASAGKKGEDLANVMMKAETKAKRRVTLSLCGLNMLDETEVETISDAKIVEEVTASPQISSKAEDLYINDEKPKSSDELGKYVINFGETHKGKTLEKMGGPDLARFVDWLYDKAKTSGRGLSGPAKDFVLHAEAYLSALEYEAKFKDSENIPF